MDIICNGIRAFENPLTSTSTLLGAATKPSFFVIDAPTAALESCAQQDITDQTADIN